VAKEKDMIANGFLAGRATLQSMFQIVVYVKVHLDSPRTAKA
jgi:hypothetical protein